MSLAALAQQAGLLVTVVDGESGRALAGVEVEVRDPATGFNRVIRTDAQGTAPGQSRFTD